MSTLRKAKINNDFVGDMPMHKATCELLLAVKDFYVNPQSDEARRNLRDAMSMYELYQWLNANPVPKEYSIEYSYRLQTFIESTAR